MLRQGLLYLKGFASSVPTVTTAQALIKCLVNLCRLSPAQEEHRTAVGEGGRRGEGWGGERKGGKGI